MPTRTDQECAVGNNSQPSHRREDARFAADGDAKGRPVGVAIDKSGALLVADDVGNIVWRVTAAGR